MHDLDLPGGDARELVVDRDRVYELNGEDSRTLAAIGTFRVVPERDLGGDRDPDQTSPAPSMLDQRLISRIIRRMRGVERRSMLFAALRPGQGRACGH